MSYRRFHIGPIRDGVRSLIPLIIVLAFFGCNEPKEREAKGDAVYGGTLDLCETEKYQTLFPQNIIDVPSGHVASQVYESLFKFDPRDITRVKPLLVRSYEISDNGHVYHFDLKRDVKFHQDPCFKNEKARKLTTADVKATFERLFTRTSESRSFRGMLLELVKGAKAYFRGEADQLEGLSIKNDHEFSLHLNRPSSALLYTLADTRTSILPKEALEKYGQETRIGTGPFLLSNRDSRSTKGDELILERYKEYHRKDSLGNQLPYLDTIRFHFINSKVEQLKLFQDDKLDYVYGLPAEKTKEVVEEDIKDFAGNPPKYILGRTPQMSTQFYEFNMTRPIFKNIHVRKAISYAIDREKLVEITLMGEAYGPGVHGITPPSFDDYDISQINGYSYKPEKAKEHLKKAGYPKGEGFPSIKIEVNSGGTENTRVAFEIQKQLKKVLNINVDIEVVPFSQKIRDQKFANGDIFRNAWIADYPSPQNFLWLAYGENVPDSTDRPSWPNTTRYENDEFDSLYVKGTRATSKEKSNDYFMKAEKALMKDPPFIILWYEQNYRLTQAYVQRLFSNPMNYYDLSQVYLKAPEPSGESEG